MTLWIVLTLMTAAMAAYVAAPFLRPIDKADAKNSSDLGIFRDQLAEVEREAAAGLIEPAAAESARTEIKRRMLTADKAAAMAHEARPLSALEHRFAFRTILALTVLGSAVLYGFTGNPGVPSGVPGVGGAAQQGGEAAPTAADVDTAVEKLAARLKADPGNVKGWAMLGWSYLGTAKYAEAAQAYRRAAALDPKDLSVKSGLSQALMRQAGGKVTPEALAVIDEVLAIDPKEPGARFDKGLAKLQGGDAKGALDAWIAQLKDAGPDDKWPDELRQRIIETAKDNGVDVSGRLPAAASAKPAAGPAPVAGPTADDIAAAQGMSAGDQAAMVKGMVERLAAKLEKDPKNLEGWIQLMRSRKVLGDPEGAKAAFKSALTVFDGAADEKSKLNAAARDLGVLE